MFQSTRKALLTATAVGALTLSGAAFAEGQFSYSDDTNRVGATNLESAPVDSAPSGPGVTASDSIGDVRQQSAGTDQLGATGESIDDQISSAERRIESAEERLQRAQEHLQSAERDLQSARMSDHGSASSRSSMDEGDMSQVPQSYSDPSSGYPSVGPQAYSDIPSGYDPYAKGTIVNRPYANVPAQPYTYGPYAYESTAWPSPAPPLTSHNRSYLQEDIYGGGEGGSDGGEGGAGAGEGGDEDSG